MSAVISLYCCCLAAVVLAIGYFSILIFYCIHSLNIHLSIYLSICTTNVFCRNVTFTSDPVTPDPDVVVREISPEDEYLILATDGM